jgi:hypothetical protein
MKLKLLTLVYLCLFSSVIALAQFVEIPFHEVYASQPGVGFESAYRNLNSAADQFLDYIKNPSNPKMSFSRFIETQVVAAKPAPGIMVKGGDFVGLFAGWSP